MQQWSSLMDTVKLRHQTPEGCRHNCGRGAISLLEYTLLWSSRYLSGIVRIERRERRLSPECGASLLATVCSANSRATVIDHTNVSGVPQVKPSRRIFMTALTEFREKHRTEHDTQRHAENRMLDDHLSPPMLRPG